MGKNDEDRTTEGKKIPLILKVFFYDNSVLTKNQCLRLKKDEDGLTLGHSGLKSVEVKCLRQSRRLEM